MRSMVFARWDPLQNLLALNERLHELVHAEGRGWIPPVDLYELEEAYVLTAELPGLAREQIRIEIADSRLVLSGERPQPSVSCEQYHNVERGFGPFSRSFDLPQPVDVDRIEARFQDGVLTVTVPKSPARHRRIDVQSV
ncbi:MAG: Hsp20/alpha crystallin family protein [Acidobacteria bacterium]|nr:Hsp20/alpha crystallin family protein [Acidobacteriota bacterium]